MKTIVVTGGAGFIGCNFVRHALRHTESKIVVVDKLTYAGHLASLEDIRHDPRFVFVQADISDKHRMQAVFDEYRPEALVNFAAETHVDRSIDNPADFVQTNLVGTYVLLAVALNDWTKKSGAGRRNFRFLHISTDEVYGTLGAEGLFSEETPYQPNSPYSASKAGADHLVRAYFETYGLPCLITNCSNNYGPYQFPEKLVPLTLLNALEGKQIPIYGDGGNVRDWLYVEDHVTGILLALRCGVPGEKYNIGGNNESSNLALVDRLCGALEKLKPAAQNPALSARGVKTYFDLKSFVADRPGHDRRYAIDSTKIRTKLGWKPAHTIETGLETTVQWYLEHQEWCRQVQQDNYGRERLGIREDPPQGPEKGAP